MQVVARLVACLSLLLGAAVSLSAQIVEDRDYHGKQIICARSGLIGWYTSCGKNDFYSQIFLGRVLSVKPVKAGEFDEFRLVLIPEEVFLGDVPPHFEVTTNQGECLPEIHSGDRWLFYIRTDKERGPILAYENDSAPIEVAEERLARLRRLAEMSDSGILMGHLNWGWTGEDPNGELANRQILATAAETGKQYRAFTDRGGHFEFDPLPAGKYKLSLNMTGLWTDDDLEEFPVEAHDCRDYLIKMAPDGLIAGRVTTADGKPVADLALKIVPTDEGHWWRQRATTDRQGRYAIHGVPAGHYLVGFVRGEGSSGDEDGFSVLYPGVTNRDRAAIVSLGNAEHREDINIVVPANLK